MAQDAMPHLTRTKICVYCGTGTGASPAHMEAARALARAMAANNIDLVYGGGTVGLMGEIAKTLVSINGPQSVHSIIPEALVKHKRAGSSQAQNIPDEAVFGRTTLVKDMHTRKKLMAEEVFAGGPGSGFIGLSGGFGTMEEIFETTTWIQLDIHSRGIVLLNIDGYWNGIINWLDKAAEEGFVKPGNKGLLAVAKTSEGAMIYQCVTRVQGVELDLPAPLGNSIGTVRTLEPLTRSITLVQLTT